MGNPLEGAGLVDKWLFYIIVGIVVFVVLVGLLNWYLESQTIQEQIAIQCGLEETSSSAPDQSLIDQLLGTSLWFCVIISQLFQTFT